MTKKYELAKDVRSIWVEGRELFRVRALRDVVRDGVTIVKRAELGGYIESEANLDQAGSCWVGDHATVLKRGRVTCGGMVSGQATVTGLAVVTGNARVNGRARIEANASIQEKALVTDRAVIGGSARITGAARVMGESRVSDSLVAEHAQICGDAIVELGASVLGNAVVADSAHVAGPVTVTGQARILGDTVLRANDGFRVDGVIELSGGRWDSAPVQVVTRYGRVFPSDSVTVVLRRALGGDIAAAAADSESQLVVEYQLISVIETTLKLDADGTNLVMDAFRLVFADLAMRRAAALPAREEVD